MNKTNEVCNLEIQSSCIHRYVSSHLLLSHGANKEGNCKWEQKVGKNANIANFVYLWKTRISQPSFSIFERFKLSLSPPYSTISSWWLIRGILLMELGLLRDFFGSFSMWGERYYFHLEGSMQGGDAHARWEYQCKVRMTTWGENGHMRWEWSCKVGMVTWGGNSHARWEWPHELTFRGGGNGHTRWEWPHRGWWRGPHGRGGLGMGMVMQGGNGHVRWERSLEVGGGIHGHVRWEWSREIRAT